MSIDVWALVDKTKKENLGWYVIPHPTTKDLKKLINDGVIMALEADECPVRFTYEEDGRVINFPLGLSEQKVRRLIFEAEQQNRKSKSV